MKQLEKSRSQGDAGFFENDIDPGRGLSIIRPARIPWMLVNDQEYFAVWLALAGERNRRKWMAKAASPPRAKTATTNRVSYPKKFDTRLTEEPPELTLRRRMDSAPARRAAVSSVNPFPQGLIV